MITLDSKEINRIQKEYQLYILPSILKETYRQLNLDALICPKCKSKGLESYGHYKRWIKTTKGKIRLKIKRVKCSCGSTHALLPSCIIPYSHISFADQITILSYYFESDSMSESDFDSFLILRGIFDDDINTICLSFKLMWKERIKSIGQSITSPSLMYDCFGEYFKQFMQTKSTSNILFSLST